MKISKRSDERPSLQVSTTFQRQIQRASRDDESFFCKIDSVSSGRKIRGQDPVSASKKALRNKRFAR